MAKKEEGSAFKMRSTNKTSFKEMGSKPSPAKWGNMMPYDYGGEGPSYDGSQNYQFRQRAGAYNVGTVEGESKRDHRKRWEARRDRISNLSDSDLADMRKVYRDRGGNSKEALEARKKSRSDFWGRMDKQDAAAAKTAEDAQYAKFAERFRTENAPKQPAQAKPLTGVDKLKANRPDFMKPQMQHPLFQKGERRMAPEGWKPQQAGNQMGGSGGSKGSQARSAKGGQRPSPRPMPQQPMNSGGGGKGSQGGKGGQRPSPRPNPFSGMSQAQIGAMSENKAQPAPNVSVEQVAPNLKDVGMGIKVPTDAGVGGVGAPAFKMKSGNSTTFKEMGSSDKKKSAPVKKAGGGYKMPGFGKR